MEEPGSTARARDLRFSAPFPERLLWGRLRNRRLVGWKFKRQVPIGRYVVDFLCMDARLIVELDGGQHSTESAVVYDETRTSELRRLGFRVIRFWNGEVYGRLDEVCETILAVLEGQA